MSEKINNKTIDFNLIIQDRDNSKTKSQKVLSTIDYLYPSLNRKDLSDLSNINDKNHQFKKLNTNRDWSLNLYNLDIEGSSPRKFGYFFNKEDFTNKNSDIEKSSPKNYNKNINKKSFNLTNDDIEFSKPQCVKNTTTRHTNPLEPKYMIKNPEIMPITPPKFIRDSMEIKDIRGSGPKKIGNDKNLFKEPIIKDIIKDSWPRKPYLRKSKYEYLDYRDVTNKFENHRNTNPLRPIYNWSYVDDKKCFGPIDGNYPLVYSKYLYKNPFNLSNKDIDDSNTGSKNRYTKFHGTNYSYNTRDIKGAQGDTFSRGIITTRNTNPLVPKYKYLGHSEIPNIDNNPYFTGFQSPGHYGKRDQKKTIDLNRNSFNNIKSFRNINGNKNTIDNNSEIILEKKEKNNSLNNNNITNNNEHINENNKILEKKIKIVDNKNENKDKYKDCIRNEEKPDFGNFTSFNDKIDFNKNKYKKPETFFGLSHYQHLIPSDLNQNKLIQNQDEKLKIPLKPLNRKEFKSRSVSTFSQKDNNYYTKLDNFINSRNLNYIENKVQNQNEKIINKNINPVLNQNNEKGNIENDNIEKNNIESNK